MNLHGRAARDILICSSAMFLAAGCANLDARPDYHHARNLIADRTGAEEVYDPSAGDLAAQRVDELLEGDLSVAEAVQIALLNNPSFQSLMADIGASRADLAQSALLTNPTLSFGIQFPEGGGRSDVTLGWAQQIAELWQIPVRKRIAAAELQRTIFSVAQRATEIASDVRVRCYRVLAQRAALTYLDEDGRLAQQLVELAERRLRAGEVSQYDVEFARSGALDVQEESIVTHGRLVEAEADLAEALGLGTRRSEIHLVGDLPQLSDSMPPYATLLDQALDERFDLRVALHNTQRAESELQLQCRRFLPDVQLGFAFERNENRAIAERKILADTLRESIRAGRLTAPAIQSRGERNIEKSMVIDAKLGPTIALALPIFDQNQAQIAKARWNVLKARKDYLSSANAIAAEIDRFVSQLDSAVKVLRFQEEHALPALRGVVQQAEQRYRGGEEDVTNLILARSNLAARRRAHVNALRDYAVAMAQLEAAVGGRLPNGEFPAAAPAGPEEDVK